MGNRRAKKRRSREAQRTEEAGGLAEWHPAYNPALRALGMGDVGETGPAAALKQMMSGFKGTPEELDAAKRVMAQMLPGTLAQTPGFQHMQGFQGFDYVQPEDYLGQYGVGAGQIGQAAQQGYQRGAGMMNRMGLGSSAALASLAGQTVQQAGSQRADLWGQIHQKMLQQRMFNTQLQAQFAGEAFDMQRQIAAMAMGGQPGAERTEKPKQNMWGPVAQLAGSALGGLLGGGGTKSGGSGGSSPSGGFSSLH
jgi:hypothetical protein